MPRIDGRQTWAALFAVAMLMGVGCGSNSEPSIYNMYDPDNSEGSDTQQDAVSDLASSPDSYTPDNLQPDGRCIPDCDDRVCGDDGCGGSCGECAEGMTCIVTESQSTCKRVSCDPGELKCDGTQVKECNDTGTGSVLVNDCAVSGASCVDGECIDCTPDCADKLCGDDGCGGLCGECSDGKSCTEGKCLLPCESPDCQPGRFCALAGGGGEALCGAVIDFDTSLQGGQLGTGFNVESAFADAGIVFSTTRDDSVVATNEWELNSDSGRNSAASLDNYGQPWQDNVVVRFVLPKGAVNQQGATHYVGLFLGQTWPNGLSVDFFSPDAPPTTGTQPFHTEMTDSEGTDFVEYFSDQPIGYVRIRTGDDPDFTMDDFEFGPVYHP